MFTYEVLSLVFAYSIITLTLCFIGWLMWETYKTGIEHQSRLDKDFSDIINSASGLYEKISRESYDGVIKPCSCGSEAFIKLHSKKSVMGILVECSSCDNKTGIVYIGIDKDLTTAEIESIINWVKLIDNKEV